MSVDLSTLGGAGAQFFDNNGVILSGGKLYTYAAGTTTPKASYTSGSGNTPHSNPIILDSAGRVPGGEIWLTTGEAYKFVLETPTGILLGTWDNIYGYTSGSAVASTEVQTATAGQTLFVLSSMAYNPGSSTLGVFIDGVNQVVGNSYVETSATSVTFMSGLHVGAVVKFINLNIASTNANVVTYTPGFVGSVATTVQEKLQQYVSVKDFGAVGDTALQAALNASDYVFVNAGTYNGPIDITQSNKTLVMADGVVFFLPNGTVVGGSVTGPAVIQISGDNVTIQGDFTVNGNKANNNSSSFPATVLTGNLNILGDNCQIYGTATVINAYYRGVTVGDSLVSGGEVQGFYASKIHVSEADFYSVMLWSVVDWSIEEIRATTSAPSVARDQRIRTGTQSSATSICGRGYIGLAYTDTNCGFIGEANTIDVSIDTVMTGDGGKLEDCTNVRIGHWNAYDCSRAAARTAFFLNNCENCHVDSVIINNFNDDGSNIPAINFTGVVSCSVGSIVSVGNNTSTPNSELRIREADGLYLGSVVLRDPVGTCDGFFYDHGYPVQQDIVVEDLISRGHTTWDITVENKTPITLRNFNSDALNQFPTNTYYPNITDKDFQEIAAWSPTYTTTATNFTSVTYDGINGARYVKQGKVVYVSGTLRTDAITVGAASGIVAIGNLPFPVKNDPDAYSAVSLSSASGFAGDVPLNGRAVPSTSLIELYYRTSVNGNDTALAPADMGTGANANTLVFGGSYETD
jgi:hypothetical protein